MMATERPLIVLIGLALGILAIFVLCGCSAPTGETVKTLDQTLAALNKHGVQYEATLSGQTAGEVWAKQSFGAGTPGWLYVTFRGPITNPQVDTGTNGK